MRAVNGFETRMLLRQGLNLGTQCYFLPPNSGQDVLFRDKMPLPVPCMVGGWYHLNVVKHRGSPGTAQGESSGGPCIILGQPCVVSDGEAPEDLQPAVNTWEPYVIINLSTVSCPGPALLHVCVTGRVAAWSWLIVHCVRVTEVH